MNSKTVYQTEIPSLELLNRGKVRDIYDLGDKLLLVTTDRISAFDVINPTPIPNKGCVLTALSFFWFDYLKDEVEGQLVDQPLSEIIPAYDQYADDLEGRSMLVKKTKPFPVECVVRGYLAGSGWKEYRRNGKVCGIDLPEGLQESAKLPEPIFTPSTKAETGHDENISFEQMVDIVGRSDAEELKTKSLHIYQKAANLALEKGIIIADTKFEFGRLDGKTILIDEVLTPDSSRFWPQEEYQLGRSQPSFDKQFVRDYLDSLAWNKEPPAPELPNDIVEKTSEKYLEAFKRITGKSLD